MLQKIILLLIFFFCLGNSSLLKKHDHCERPPIEKEEDQLRSSIYCNSKQMESGDNCYCGRAFMQCCQSNKYCSGSVTRSCEKPIDNYFCEDIIGQGLAYWREFKITRQHFDCTNTYKDTSTKTCFCGEDCCSSNQFCSGMFPSCQENKKLDNRVCINEVKKLLKNEKTKYYENYKWGNTDGDDQ